MGRLGAIAILAFTTLTVTAQQPAQARVHFYRYKQGFVGRGIKPAIWADGIEIEKRVPDGFFLDVKFPPGQHFFSSEDRTTPIVLTLAPGKDYYFALTFQEQWAGGHFRLALVGEQEGSSAESQLKPLENGSS